MIVMMKFVILLCHPFALLLMIFGIVEGTIDYGSVINNVHDKYMTGSIIISARTAVSFERNTMIHKIMRELSGREIASVFMNFMQLEEGIRSHNRQRLHPLVVIFIDEITELYNFPGGITKIHTNYFLKLGLFIGNGTEDHCGYCHDPIGNPFNLGLTSKMLILCCDSEYIEEWWSWRENQTSTLPRGKWDGGVSKFNWYANESIYTNKQSAGNRGLRVVIVKGSRQIWKKNHQLYGYYGELLTGFCKAMNFSISQVIEETTYGHWNSESSMWTGAIGIIVQGKADIGAAPYLITTERAGTVDFTLPITSSTRVLGIKKPDEVDILWNACFKPFHGKIWMVITIFLLIIPLSLTIIKYQRKYNFLDMVCEHYLNVWGILCQKSPPDPPKGVHLRIVYISTYTMAIVLYAMYSAVFISYLTTLTVHLPFRSLEEFISDGTYKMIVVKNQTEYVMLKRSNDTLFKTMELMMPPDDSLPPNQKEAFEQICTKKYAYFFNRNVRRLADIHSPCEIKLIDVGGVTHSGMILPQNSEYARLLKSYLQRIKVNGLMSRLTDKYFKKTSNIPDDSYKPVTLKGVISILITFAVGFSIAFIIFCIELP